MPLIGWIPGSSFPRLWLCVAFFFFARPSESRAAEEPRLNLRDTTLLQNDSLVFAPQTFNACLYTYDSEYEVVPDPGQSETGRFLIRMTARRSPACATLAGYSGPVVVLKDLPLGRYRLLFTDSSDFKITVPDSIQIRVIEAGSGLRPRKSGMATPSMSRLTYYSMNGRMIHGFGLKLGCIAARKNRTPDQSP